MARITRNTKQKEIMIGELSKMTTFFFAEDFYKKIKKIDKSIGIATIYRFLKEQRNKNKLYSYVCNRRSIYSIGEKSHCHFICEKTGKIIHFEIDSLDFLKNKIPGKITSFQLEVKGICKECKKD